MNNSASVDDRSVEASVYERYAKAAQQREQALCCPTEYSADFLSVIPEEILERDYGCGDPTPYVHEGEVVLDLGSGGGKLCYILSQVVGERGRVIGVDCNLDMLALARKFQQQVADRVGYSNVDLRYGMIQDLRLDLDLLGRELGQHPVRTAADWVTLRHLEERLRRDQPMITDESVDCVVSNCVLNLVRQQDRRRLFEETYRVLRRGGRAAISDIVSDEDIPDDLQRDPTLWSGCISGAFREDLLLQAFEESGFHGIEIVKRQREPWQSIRGIEFRSVTLVAHKGKVGPCLERNQAVMYRGPFRRVEDDDGHAYDRGQRTAVCDKTYQLLRQSPYSEHFFPIEPYAVVETEHAEAFDCRRAKIRHPRESKGQAFSLTTPPVGSCCTDGECC
ncbi:MAG: methyltransferase domain-containing protein [Pirellulales bacterium]